MSAVEYDKSLQKMNFVVNFIRTNFLCFEILSNQLRLYMSHAFHILYFFLNILPVMPDSLANILKRKFV